MKGARSGASLRLTELIFSVLIFSLCAAVILQLFSASHRASEDARNLDRAVFAAESAMETLRTNPTLGGSSAWYDGDWNPVDPNFTESAYYVLGDTRRDGSLVYVTVTVYAPYIGGEVLYELTTSWYLPESGVAE